MSLAAQRQILADLALRAKVPEHSPLLMAALSGGEPLLENGYLFFQAKDTLLAIGYPFEGEFHPASFAAACRKIQRITNIASCFAIAPAWPAELPATILEADRYYVLSAKAPIPSRLRNPVQKAGTVLQIRESPVFTPGHRRLFAEFLRANADKMSDRVAELYAKTQQFLRNPLDGLIFLDALDQAGNVVATLLLDHGPLRFTSYILGAHSRQNYVPHAVDLLFAAMLDSAAQRGKKFIHLGLGVNDGILRFKKKWGAKPGQPFLMAKWEAGGSARLELCKAVAQAFLHSGNLSKREIIANEPSVRPFAMLWRVAKNNNISYLAGTAHFFCHSFESSFRHLFSRVDNVIFEGPLDPQFMAEVDKAGKILPQGCQPLLEALTEAEIAALERTVHGPKGFWARALGLEHKGRKADVRWLLRNGLPWYAFFTLWTSFLERLGWRESVDMEAWRIAREMGKNVMGMESLAEQLESLGSLPPARALNFFRACKSWKARARQNLSAYLAGDLEKMMGSSAEFPTRTEHIVGRRDQRFRERMRPYLEKGRTAVFVGSAHLVNLRQMLAEDGFEVRQTPYGIWPRLHLRWRSLARPDEGVKW